MLHRMTDAHRDTLRRVVVSANVAAAMLSGVAAVLARRNPAGPPQTLSCSSNDLPAAHFVVANKAYRAGVIPLFVRNLGA